MDKEQFEEYLNAVIEHPEVLLSGLNKLWDSPVIHEFIKEKITDEVKEIISDLNPFD